MAKTLVSDFKIIFFQSVIFRSKRGAITAPIYWDWGDYQFPEVGWSDFVVVVLSWWIEGVIGLADGVKKTAELSFMDGPMMLRLCSIDDNRVVVQCVDQVGDHEVAEYESLVSLTQLCSELRSASLKVLDECKKSDWSSDDIENLERNVQALETGKYRHLWKPH